MGKKVDLTGQRFGKLVVLGDSGKRGHGAVMWDCACDCGNKVTKRTCELGSGKCRSCFYRDRATNKVDLTGHRFGEWTVLEDSGNRGRGGNILWKCVCDCGEHRLVDGNSLRNGSSKSCGCSNRLDLIGCRFGRLVVLGSMRVNERSGWLCECDCGKKTHVITSALTSGNSKSCGCNKRYRIGETHPNYNPKLTDQQRIKQRYELKGDHKHKWSKKIMERDNYTCQICNKHGGKLNAHHLNGWNAFPEQRFDLDNGVTLCTDCHKDFHSQYGYGDNTREQFNEYAASKTLVLN